MRGPLRNRRQFTSVFSHDCPSHLPGSSESALCCPAGGCIRNVPCNVTTCEDYWPDLQLGLQKIHRGSRTFQDVFFASIIVVLLETLACYVLPCCVVRALNKHAEIDMQDQWISVEEIALYGRLSAHSAGRARPKSRSVRSNLSMWKKSTRPVDT